MPTIRCTLLLLAAALPATASQFTVPSGFNFESIPLGGSVEAVLEDGSLLVRTGSFGNESLSRLQADGTLTLFATGIGSLAGIAQSTVTGRIVVGDSFGAAPLWLLRDRNADGDALDPGEMLAHPATLPVLSNGAAPLPFDMAFRPGTDELYVSGSTPFGVDPTLGAVVRITNATSFFSASANLWADGFGLASGVLFDGDDLYLADVDATTFAGRVVTLTDGNSDGDALDAGEAVDFAAGLTGAFDLALAADGSFYLSGTTDFSDFSSAVARLLPDGNEDGVSDGVDELYLDGWIFSSNLVLVEGPGGFAPGAHGDGVLFVGDFSFVGARSIASAPLAETSVTGTVANNSAFTIEISGAPNADALLILSLDPVGATLAGIGDLCLGFAAPFIITPVLPLGPTGSVDIPLVLHDATDLVGETLVLQSLTFENGEIGLSNGLTSVVGP